MPTDSTLELLERHYNMTADNSHAFVLERAALVIRTAADVPADREPVARVSAALRDWTRENVADVLELGRYRLRARWAADRQTRVDRGENLAHAPGFYSFEDSTPESWRYLVLELAGTACDVLPWDSIARELLETDYAGVTYADAGATLRELRRLEQDPAVRDSSAGEVPAWILAGELDIESAQLAERLEVLRVHGLAGARYVGGTSGTLCSTYREPVAPVAPYVPDRITLES